VQEKVVCLHEVQEHYSSGNLLIISYTMCKYGLFMPSHLMAQNTKSLENG